jgi:hypothetical protein
MKNSFETEAADEIRMRIVANWRETQGYFPTYREIMSLFGWASKGSVKKFTDRCLKRGWLTRKGNHFILK